MKLSENSISPPLQKVILTIVYHFEVRICDERPAYPEGSYAIVPLAPLGASYLPDLDYLSLNNFKSH